MLSNLQHFLQYLAIFCFSGLTIISFLQHSVKFTGLNFALAILYIFLYLVK